jgi:hypothetical protein
MWDGQMLIGINETQVAVKTIYLEQMEKSANEYFQEFSLNLKNIEIKQSQIREFLSLSSQCYP